MHPDYIKRQEEYLSRAQKLVSRLDVVSKMGIAESVLLIVAILLAVAGFGAPKLYLAVPIFVKIALYSIYCVVFARRQMRIVVVEELLVNNRGS